MSSLRILIMLHLPLSRELGGARAQLELAHQWRRQGHHVETFDINGAFPQQTHSLLATLTRPSFAQRAKVFIREQGHRFDIIDAHQGNVPFTKQALNFKGLLVNRSVGLHPFYATFNRQILMRTRSSVKTRLVTSLLNWRDRDESHRCWRSYQVCDLLNLPNPTEKAYLDRYLNTQHKSHVFPFGLTPQQVQGLGKVATSERRRSPHPTVVFIGTWGPRRGASDWCEIIQRIRQAIPQTRFLLLGTGIQAERIAQDLQLPLEGIQVVPRYTSDELPGLLETATVGVFPTYVEGFGFAVLEKLAAGIPTVSYEAAGPKVMLNGFEPHCLVPIGDVQALAQQVIKILQLPASAYQTLSSQAQTVARTFNWEAIAHDTLQTYQAALARLAP